MNFNISERGLTSINLFSILFETLGNEVFARIIQQLIYVAQNIAIYVCLRTIELFLKTHRFISIIYVRGLVSEICLVHTFMILFIIIIIITIFFLAFYCDDRPTNWISLHFIYHFPYFETSHMMYILNLWNYFTAAENLCYIAVL